MCGIIGYVGKKNALGVIINGLERLEYRGYDSCGVAFLKNKKIELLKESGKIENLKKQIDFSVFSDLGIGHTRWATHGEPNKTNSHPHKVGRVTIVHNGIIENYMELKSDLIKNGYSFQSETDTEVLCAYIDYLYKNNDISYVMENIKKNVKGSYALAIIFDDRLDSIFAIKKESPLIIALGKDENYIASDVPAILKYTNKYIILNDLEYAQVKKDAINFYNKNKKVKKEIKLYSGDSNDVDKNGHEHYMEKEIYEEPSAIMSTIDLYDEYDNLLKNMPDFTKYNKIEIVACGSAMHAGMVGKVLFEKYANISVNVEVASEYRYKKLFLDKKTLVIIISQSGETADSLAALKIAKENHCDTLGIINVVESSIARLSDIVLYTKAGPEIAVATTKAYITQLNMLALIALNLSIRKGYINETFAKEILLNFKSLPIMVKSMIERRKEYLSIAKKIYKYNDIFFIGRGLDYSLCLEGSLKLKEISYINSQGYPAGELKHGTISLISKGTPVIAIITDKNIAEKTISNVKEVKARGAYVILVIKEELDINDNFYDKKIIIPNTSEFTISSITIVPLQLLAYEIAKLRKCDIDKPKNLAKSVTVE